MGVPWDSDVAPTRGVIKDVSKSGKNSAKLVSDLNSVVGERDIVYVGKSQLNAPHGSGWYDYIKDAKQVKIGQTGGFFQMLYFSTSKTTMGPAHQCPKQGCPFVPVHEIKVASQKFHWSNALGWKRRGGTNEVYPSPVSPSPSPKSGT